MATSHQKIDHTPYDIIVFCHLRWEFVYQRPQHIVSRLAQHGRVLFIEEPIPHDPAEAGTAHLYKVNERITVMQPKVPTVADIAGLFTAHAPIRADIGWVYSPAFVELLPLFAFDKLVYDCMDELTLFRGAPARLVNQEAELLRLADVVFTGGKSLYESKKAVHPNVYCFPSSVDRGHFEKALNGIPLPHDMPQNGTLTVGYYGVIDERMDMDLLAQTAARMPEVQFVMVGPLAKVTDAELAKGPNIRYTGIRSYDELPGYLKAFDIAMMPFALNDSTRYISPTKTLEYMAAQKPIISTPVYDVVRDYAHCVSIVSNADGFCEAIYKLSDLGHRKAQIPHYERILDNTSWDHTVQAMHQILKS